MKRLFKFRYPKLAGLVFFIALAYVLFGYMGLGEMVSHLNSYGYLGAFIAGLFFTFGFSSPFSAGFFITLNPENIWLAGLLGGFGAFLGDMFIFKFIRFSFRDEFDKLKKTKNMKKYSALMDTTFGHKIKVYLMYAFAGILIASPLPDEAGIIMLAGLTKIKAKILGIISFLLNTIGILILLLL